MAGLRRRSFIVMASLGLFLPFVFKSISAMAGYPAGHFARAIYRRRILALFDDVGAAQVMGRQYLDSYPDEADGDRILGEMVNDAGRARPIRGLEDMIARARERDFRRGDTVIIDGWVLARTEARVCALTILL